MLLSQGTEFKIYYGGDQHQIDANTFVNSLVCNLNLIEEANKSLGSDKRIDVKVKAPEKGSFIIELYIEANNVLDNIVKLFSPENVDYTNNILGVLTVGFTTWKFLKGKKPQNTEKTDEGDYIIVNGDDNQIRVTKNVYNFILKDSVQELMAKNFDSLKDEDNITSFEIKLKNDETILKIPKEEFEELSQYETTPAESERTDTSEETLKIIRPSFERTLKSDFYWEGFKINAKITDEVFLRKIDEGERFAKGDYLKVKLSVTKKYDESVDTFVNKSFTIIEVISHIPRGTQTSID